MLLRWTEHITFPFRGISNRSSPSLETPFPALGGEIILDNPLINARQRLDVALRHARFREDLPGVLAEERRGPSHDRRGVRQMERRSDRPDRAEDRVREMVVGGTGR